MAKKKKKEKETTRQAYGITVLKASDKRVRQLKKNFTPFIHGNKFWNSSWCVMDFLSEQGLPSESRVLEIGCGWGLAGMYCAKNYGAEVRGMDADSAVFPYLNLHAEVNEVEIETWRCKFDRLTVSKSTMPMVPTPAAARYINSGAPSPPAPTTSTLLSIRRA